MKIEDCVLIACSTVKLYDSIRSIESKLREKDYLVVVDEKNTYYGILTPSDILARPYKLVIDCITPKGMIQTNDSFVELISKFNKTPSEALPVFRNGEYLGILEKNTVITKFKSNLDDFIKESKLSQKAETSFLHNLSHEVRTPLNQILGFLSLVADLSPEKIEPKRDMYYAIIQKSADQFLSIMDDLIEFSLLYSGDKVQIHNTNTPIETIFADVKANFSDGEYNIRYYNPDKTLMIYTDSKKLKQIIHHLIQYTINQSQKDDGVEFGYELSGNEPKIRFYVKNTNAPINDIPKNISSDSPKKSTGPKYTYWYGTGFDIGFVKKMLELLEGTLDVEEFGTGKITTYFTIPYNSYKSLVMTSEKSFFSLKMDN